MPTLLSSISNPAPPPYSKQIRLIDTQYSNSAYHGAALDQHHIASELERFLQALERKYGITRQAIAAEGKCAMPCVSAGLFVCAWTYVCVCGRGLTDSEVDGHMTVVS